MLSSDSGIKRFVKYSDWMNDENEEETTTAAGKSKKKKIKKLEIQATPSESSSSSSSSQGDKDEENYDQVFEKTQYEGKKGHLLLQLQKTYKGDDRFKLAEDSGFDIDLKDKDAKKVLP